jgi:phosphoenolpyruvate---glycerone phosphotransferase subunit DhaL
VSVSYDQVVQWIHEFQGVVASNKDYLTQLDAAIGDADHGINMDRGMKAAVAKIDGHPSGDIGSLLKTVGMALVSSVGGAGGPLYGTLFMQLGTALTGKSEMDLADWNTAVEAGVKGVQMRGKAEAEDKTMLDAWMPARESLQESLDEGSALGEALIRSAAAAEEGMKATIPLVARKGRASYLGERSAGHQDPGATSTYLLLKCAAETWGTK